MRAGDRFASASLGAVALVVSVSVAVLGSLLASSPAFGRDRQRFVLKWEIGDLPLEVRTGRAPVSELGREAETGFVGEGVRLPVVDEMKDGAVVLEPSDDAPIYLFLKNKGRRSIRFSVAPHSTAPGASALGFTFGCLCNGHVYEVPAGQTWYRVMRLRRRAAPSFGRDVTLVHRIFEVKAGAPAKNDARSVESGRQ